MKHCAFFTLILLLICSSSMFAQYPDDPYLYDFPEDGTRESAYAAAAFREHYLKSMDYTMNISMPGFIRKSVNNVRLYNAKEGRHVVIADYSYKWIDLGPAVETGRPLDVVVEGHNRAFFTVQLPGGLVAYTKDGRFRVDFENRLVTLAGNYPVLGEEGYIIIEDQQDVQISRSGGVYVNGLYSDRILVTVFKYFEDMDNHLDNLSGTFFTLDAEIEIEEGHEHYQVLQGHSRQSNSFKAHDSWFYKKAHQMNVNTAFKLIDTNRQLFNAISSN